MSPLKSDFLVGYRKPISSYKLSRQGIVFFLPTAIDQKTRLIFKGTHLYRQMGLTEFDSERLNLRVEQCETIDEKRFKITSHFVGELDTTFRKQMEQYIEEHGEAPVEQTPNTITCLITCDQKKEWGTYRNYFKNTEYKLVFAINGMDALNKLQDNSVDILLVDTDHLHKNGLPFIKSVQRLSRYLPIMIVTQERSPQLIEPLSNKVDNLLLKPINMHRLQHRLQLTLQSRLQANNQRSKSTKKQGVHLKTDLLLVFRDAANIEQVVKDGLIFYKGQPIAPSTKIYFRAQALFKKMGLTQRNVAHLELNVISCEAIDPGVDYFQIRAQFQNVPSYIQEAIDAFVDGKPLKNISEEAAQQAEALGDDALDAFFLGANDDFVREIR